MGRVIIFGSNKGIGLALASIYSRDHDVYAVCRTVSSELNQLPVKQVFQNIDVTNAFALQELAGSLKDLSFDVLIHNAGIWLDDAIFSESPDFSKFTESFETNAIAPLKVVSRFAPLINQGGKIGLMSSLMGSMSDNTSGGRYGYRMSKAALNAAGKSMSIDLAESRRISVAVLHPGYVRTNMTGFNGLINPEEAAAGLKRVMDNLSLSNSGKFWHSNGESLNW